MKLREYLEKKGIKITSFARQIGVTETTMHNILSGKDLKLTTALKIERLTEGAVKCCELGPQEAPPPSKRKSRQNKVRSCDVENNKSSAQGRKEQKIECNAPGITQFELF
jgi:DNA-binding transcriptional regulator YdaS (Cro superfamily)